MRISFVSPCGNSGGVLYPLDLSKELSKRHEVEFWCVAFFGEPESDVPDGARYVRLDRAYAFPDDLLHTDVIVCINWQAVSLVNGMSEHLMSTKGTDPLRDKVLINLIQGDERGWAPPSEVMRLMSLPGWKNIFVSDHLRKRMIVDGVPDGPVVNDGISDAFFDDLDETVRPLDLGVIISHGKNSNVVWPSLFKGGVRTAIGIGGPQPTGWSAPGWEWIDGPVGRDVVAREMRRCRFWLCPSMDEGFGLVPIEAMAAGAIPVAFRTGIVADLEDDFPGIIVDDPSGWDVAVGRCMMMGDEERALRSLTGKELAQKFRMERTAAMIEEEIRKPTLSVCMITKNGKELMDACLSSIDGLWDELIIVIDDGPEEGMEEVCLRHGATVLHRAMNHDFASQRNHGFDVATGDWILWLDSDDLVPPATVERIRELVAEDDPSSDGYYLDYHYAHDGDGNVTTCLRRERLLKRSSGWRWRYEIHEVCECENPEANIRFVTGFPIVHKRELVPQEFRDPSRNLRFLDKVLDKYMDDPRMLFYVAKENQSANLKSEAMRYFKMVVELLSKRDEYDEHLLMSCLEISSMYNEAGELKHARRWAYKAIDYDARWAESYCLLGNIAEKMGDPNQAIDMFEAARNLPIPDEIVLPTNPMMYDEFPTEMIRRLKRMDVIVPVHGEADYLELCLSSLKRNSLPTTNVIVVSNTPEIERIRGIVDESPGTVLIENGRDLSFAENCNIGIMVSRAGKVCLLNSDTIVTPGWDEDLIRVSNTDDMAIVAAFSNGEYGWRHEEEILVDGVPLVNKHRLDDLGFSTGRMEEICGEWADHNRGNVEEYEWVTFASVVIPRRVIRVVGMLDDKFKNSMEDVDYCVRLKKMGGRCLYTRGSFVFHFCGTSRYPYGKTALVNDDVNTKVFQRKVVLSDMSVTFYLGESWESWTPDSINTTGIGGSETCVVNVARCLSDWGWNVEVFSTDADVPIRRDGVIYRNYREFDPLKKTDVLVVSRRPFVFDHQLGSRLNVLYNHDASYGPEESPLFPSAERIAHVDIMFMLSEWHRQAYGQLYPHIPDDKYVITRNGIDIRRFDFARQGIVHKDMKRCFYSSSADRGLEVLLKIWPRLREIDPDLELHIFYGMETWRRSVEMGGDPAAIERMNAILDGCEQEGITYHGRMGQMTLAREMMKSNLWLYPTWFGETSCCLPGTMIRTRNGLSPIEDVKVGDEVLTHDGSYHRVTDTMSRQFDGTIYGFKTKKTPWDLWVTGEHPLLTHHFERGCGSRTVSQVKHVAGSIMGNPKVTVSWVPAERMAIDKRTWLVYPRAVDDRDVSDRIDVSETLRGMSRYSSSDQMRVHEHHIHFPKSKSPDLPRHILLDERFGAVIGRYIAEGDYGESGGQITLAFNSDERDDAIRIAGIVKALWGIESSLAESKGNWVTLVISCRVLGRLLSTWCGKGAREKHIPEFAWNAPLEFKLAMLSDMFLGDGNVNENREVTEYTTTSDRLAFEINDLILSLGGDAPGWHFNEDRHSHKLTWGFGSCQALDEALGVPPRSKERNRTSITIDSGCLKRIQRIETKHYSGLVYNLEVEGNESYVANGIAVHNCITGMESLASLCVPVTTPMAALKETLTMSAGESRRITFADFVDGDCTTDEYQDEFVEKVRVRLENPDMERRMFARDYILHHNDWRRIASEWTDLFLERL